MGDADKTGRWLIGALVAAALAAGVYLLIPRAPGDAAEPTRTARAWADRLGMRVTGVVCDGRGVCTIAPENGVPFVAFCGETTCAQERCPK